MNAPDTNNFPGFPSKPSRNLFPMYGYVPAGKGWSIQCDVRKKTGATDSHSEMVNPIPGVIASRKTVEKICYDLNLRVWQVIQAAS